MVSLAVVPDIPKVTPLVASALAVRALPEVVVVSTSSFEPGFVVPIPTSELF
jgi:hypothetical protein